MSAASRDQTDVIWKRHPKQQQHQRHKKLDNFCSVCVILLRTIRLSLNGRHKIVTFLFFPFRANQNPNANRIWYHSKKGIFGIWPSENTTSETIGRKTKSKWSHIFLNQPMFMSTVRLKNYYWVSFSAEIILVKREFKSSTKTNLSVGRSATK